MLHQVTLLAVIGSALAGPLEVPQLDGRIVGGEKVNVDQFPHQLALERNSGHLCGASIIASNVALTAAHCTNGFPVSELAVRAGTSIRGMGGQVVKVDRIIQHPSYNYTDYDISLLLLSQHLTMGKPIQLIESSKEIPDGTPLTISGWGRTSEGGSSAGWLQAVNVPALNDNDCKQAYGEMAVTARMFCAGYKEGGKDACQGDSGGPLILDNIQVGISSWGYGCARPSYPGIYTKISNLRDWIKKEINI